MISQTNQSNAESAANLKGRRKGNKNLEYWQREYMMQWLEQNEHNVYPSEGEKLRIAKHLGIHKKKISNWFINIRKRYYQSDEKVRMNKYRYKPKLQIKKQEKSQKLVKQDNATSIDMTPVQR